MGAPVYVPPPFDSDEPLDAVEEAVVRMWIDVLLPLCREALAAPADPDDTTTPRRGPSAR